jgi:hypothetical protein
MIEPSPTESAPTESDTDEQRFVATRGSHQPAQGHPLTVTPKVFAESFAVYEQLIPQANMGKTNDEPEAAIGPTP